MGGLSNLRPIQLKRFPLLGGIACGEPIFAQEDRRPLIADAKLLRTSVCWHGATA
ncbi:MAG: hypothetical protein ACLT3Y_10235 [Ruminococcus callidus]